MIERRFFVVPMPLDKNGNGPADRRDAVRWQYEVWDGLTNLAIASFDTRDEANQLAPLADKVAAITTYLRSIGE